MKNIEFIGFISEYDSDIPEAIAYESYFNGKRIDQKYRDKVLEYLKNGIICSAAMHVTEDLVSGESLGPAVYYTDGKWIWPEYMMYYLKNKPDYIVEDRFIHDLINKGFKYDKNKINQKKLRFFISKHIYGWWFAFKTFYLPNVGYRLKSMFR